MTKNLSRRVEQQKRIMRWSLPVIYTLTGLVGIATGIVALFSD